MAEITVIVTAYNIEKYIGRCLDSFLHNDFKKEFQVLVVDDASEDGTGGILDNYCQQYPGLINAIRLTSRGGGIKCKKYRLGYCKDAVCCNC